MLFQYVFIIYQQIFGVPLGELLVRDFFRHVGARCYPKTTSDNLDEWDDDQQKIDGDHIMSPSPTW